MTRKEKARELGIINPGGTVNNYQWVKHVGRLGSRKDHTWFKDLYNPRKGFHSCCKSKRDYYHKIDCPAANAWGDVGDLSDLKDIV